jgi:EamA domain-containing membrane protein RarD
MGGLLSLAPSLGVKTCIVIKKEEDMRILSSSSTLLLFTTLGALITMNDHLFLWKVNKA